MQRRARWLSALVFAVSALGAAVTVRHAWEATTARDARWLAQSATDVPARLAERVRCLSASVDALRGALASSTDVTPDEWRTYAATVTPGGTCRAVRGVAYIAADPPRLVHRSTDPPSRAMDDETWLRLFAAVPAARLGPEPGPVFGPAVPVASESLALFMAAVPGTTPTSPLRGWAALLISPTDLLDGLADAGVMSVRVEDASPPGRVATVLDTIGPGQPVVVTREFEVGGRRLRLSMADARPSSTGTRTIVGVVALLGVLQTITLTWLVYTLAASRERYARRAAESDASLRREEAEKRALSLEERRAQEALQRSEQQYRRVVEQVEQVIFQLDMDGRWTFLNRAWHGLTGYDVHASIGQPMLGFLHPDDQGAAQALCAELLACRKDECRQDLRFVTHTGATWWGAVHARPLVEDGVFIGIAGTITDVSARRQVQQELERARAAAEQASAAKSEFLQSMSHEMRTPLNGVLGLMELLSATALDAQQSRYVAVARASATQLSTLITDILDLSRIDAGAFALERTRFDLPDLIESALDVVAAEATAKRLRLSSTVTPDVPTWVIGDPGRVRQVLVHLLANAVKFTEQGEVHLHAAARVDLPARTGVVRIDVHDTGIGITPDRIERLFLPFTPGDASSTRRHGGTGLGLSICKRLVEAMDGTIAVHSVEHAGATFTVELPIEVADPAAVESQRQGDGPLRVLAVLPDEADRAAIGRLLEGWRLAAVVVDDCTAALGHLEAAPPSRRRCGVVLLDGLTPGAAAFARRVRDLSPAPGVVWITPEDGHLPSDVSGVREQIVRPVKDAALFDAIMQAVVGPTTVPSDVPSPSVWTRRLRVLVAEDHDINQMVVKDMLQSMGCDVDLVANGEQAVAAALAVPYDVVLMDCQMPVLDGLEATRRIRQARLSGQTTHDPRIIALTASATADHRQACLEAGMDAYLTKPMRGPVLQRTLQRLVPDAPAATVPDGPSVPMPSRAPAEPVIGAGRLEAPDVEDILDPAEVLLRCNRNGDLGAKMLELFAESLPAELESLEAAAAANDVVALGRLAHKLRGAAATLAAARLAGAISGLELFLTYGDGGPLSDLIADIRHESALFLGAVPQTVRRLTEQAPSPPASF